MGKLKLADDKKSRPLPISLKPKHIQMLAELEKYMRKNRSRIIQILVEREYEQKIKSIAEGNINDSG